MENLNTKKVKCTGCSLCHDICPTGAIEIVYDKEGFFTYKIDEKKCVNCGLCVKKCPKIVFKNNNESIKSCYSAYSKNADVLKKSSSGGIFYEIASNFINDGGIVIGARFENLKVKHIMVDNINDLELIMGSKYLQSNLTGIYKQIAKQLNNNKKVLFVGTPCQVAALKNFTSNDNLYVIDLVCHGVPSQFTFDDMIKQRFNNKIHDVNFRYKIKSWRLYNIKYDNHSTIYFEDPWFKTFLNNKNLKLDCYDCPFVSKTRLGDLTLSDFWGIEQIDNDFYMQNADKGISGVLINNEKGKKLFEDVRSNLIYKKQNIEDLYKYNPRLFNCKYEKQALVERKKFFEDFNNNKISFKNKNNFSKIMKKIYRKVKRIIWKNR